MQKIYNHAVLVLYFLSIVASGMFLLGSSNSVNAAPLFDVNQAQVLSYQQAHNDCALDNSELIQKYGEELGGKAAQYCQSGNAAEIAAFCSIDDGSSDINSQYDLFYSKYLSPAEAVGNGNYGDQFCEAASLLDATDGSIRDDITDQQRNALGNAEARLVERDALAQGVLDGLGCADRASTGPTDICEQPDFRIIDYCRNPNVTESACDEVKERLPVQTLQQQSGDFEEEGQTSCEDNDGEFVFFICAIIRGASATINELDARVRSALEIKPQYYEDGRIREAWANFRNIAYILLIPTLLIMVIGTALGLNFLDPYTVKRALPRLLAAVIFIALSYEICVFLIEIVTIVGQGVGGLIAAPFGGADSLTLTNLFAPSAGQGATIFLGGGVIAGVAVAVGAVSLGILASYLLVGALGLIIIFAVLTIREMIILFLIILAPIAIIAWIFPGNDKPWKLWWGTFWKLLILYPLIVGLLVVGRAFAYIISEVDATGIEGVFLTFAKLVAYIGPFFLIPAAFKFVGGVFANLAGMANDKSRGVFDRQRKYRGDARKQNFERARSGNRFRGGTENNLRGRFNRAIEGGTNIDKAGVNPLNMRSNMRTALSDHADDEAAEFKEKNAAFRAFKGDDAKLYAAEAEDRESIARRLEEFDNDRFGGPENARAREDAVTQIMRAQREASPEVFQRARIRAMAATGTGYQREVQRRDENDNLMYNPDGSAVMDTVFDSSQMLRDINRTYGNDRNGAGKALAEMRGALSNSGQIAGQAGFGTWAAQLESVHNDNSAANAERAHMTIMDNAADSVTPGQALYGKPTSAAALGASHARRVQAAQTQVNTEREALAATRNMAGTDEEIEAARAQINDRIRVAEGNLDASMAAAAGILDSMSHSATPQNASAFANELNGVVIQGSGAELSRSIATGQVDAATPDVTVRKMIEQRSNTPIDLHPEFHNRRREQTRVWDDEARRNAPTEPGANVTGGPSSGVPGA